MGRFTTLWDRLNTHTHTHRAHELSFVNDFRQMSTKCGQLSLFHSAEGREERAVGGGHSATG